MFRTCYKVKPNLIELYLWRCWQNDRWLICLQDMIYRWNLILGDIKSLIIYLRKISVSAATLSGGFRPRGAKFLEQAFEPSRSWVGIIVVKILVGMILVKILQSWLWSSLVIWVIFLVELGRRMIEPLMQRSLPTCGRAIWCRWRSSLRSSLLGSSYFFNFY